MKLHKFTSKNSGFTLIELLTVIAIIAILAAIIIPVTGKVRENARITKCASNLREIGRAMFLYAAENKNKFPVQTTSPISDPLLPATTADSWIRGVSPFLSMQSQTQLNDQNVLTCPNVIQDQSALLVFSYAMNYYLAGKRTNLPANPSQIVLLRHSGQVRSSFLVSADISLTTGLNYSDKNGRYNYLFADGHVAMHTPLLPAAQWNFVP